MQSKRCHLPRVNEAFQNLAAALRHRRALIADRDFYARDPGGHLAALQTASHAIELAAEVLPRPVDRDLEHYLTRASYDKALAWLEAQNTPPTLKS